MAGDIVSPRAALRLHGVIHILRLSAYSTTTFELTNNMFILSVKVEQSNKQKIGMISAMLHLPKLYLFTSRLSLMREQSDVYKLYLRGQCK